MHYPAKSRVFCEPYGVALIMSPWNYPLQLTMEPLIGAIAAGNCAIIKPSIQTPLTSHAMTKVIQETFDPRYIAAVEGGREENTALLQERIFTGSVAVGKFVMESASKYLTPISLELGGKSPCIVDKSADLELAAKKISLRKMHERRIDLRCA